MADNINYGTTGKPHPYHIVRPSPWPLVSSLAAGLFAMGFIFLARGTEIAGMPAGKIVFAAGTLGIVACMFFWWKDIIYETVTENVHNKVTEIGMRYGMALFIASEVMFFVAFFWAFFDAALFPGDALGWTWPPADVYKIDAFDLPFLMTMILLLSGCTVTWAHAAVMQNNQEDLVTSLGLTVGLGVLFMGFQAYEYGYLITQGLDFGQSKYTSVFYMATGFHGFHVLVGTIFLAVCWIRAMKGHFTADKHFGFEAAAWYWHFVDVVWLFLFVAVYWWGNTIGMDLSDSAQAIAAQATAE